MTLHPRLRDVLVCPRDQQAIVERGETLACPSGHSYPCVKGIPVMLVDEAPQTHWIAAYSLEHLRDEPAPLPDDGIDPFVREALGATCGNLYASIGTTIDRYPIPAFPVRPARAGERLLDVGCSWGRWSVSAARAGFHTIGIDPSLPAIHAARRVSAQLGVDAAFVVGDARFLPFRRSVFDAVFSYSVLQHFSPGDFHASVAEAGRVLAASGRAVLQMPNRYGLRNVVQQARRGFTPPRRFDVRYWSPAALRRELERSVGPAHLTVDGYFSLNPQMTDLSLLPRRFRAVVRVSDWLRRTSTRIPLLVNVADSVYVHATRACTSSA